MVFLCENALKVKKTFSRSALLPKDTVPVFKGEDQVANFELVDFLDADGYPEGFVPARLVFVVVDDGLVFRLERDAAAHGDDALDDLPVLGHHAHRHLHVLVARLAPLGELAAEQAQVQVVPDVPRQNHFREAHFAREGHRAQHQVRILLPDLSQTNSYQQFG